MFRAVGRSVDEPARMPGVGRGVPMAKSIRKKSSRLFVRDVGV
jgi:hypothetical protein